MYAATLGLSAFLLFAVQPMFARLILPKLGGAPSVWAVAMCFFQAALLAGYAYAHALDRFASPRAAVLIHIGLLLLALLALPIGVAARWGDPPAGDAYRWQLLVMATGVGLPFLAIAATAPLLQSWFARSGHPHAGDPYFLYGASNFGSLGALLLYPVLIEPGLGLVAQSQSWSLGFLLLGALIWGCARLMLEAAETGPSRTAETRAEAVSQHATGKAPSTLVTWSARARWVFLSFVPSALIIAVTNHITTDIASAPFLWVIPLALFLATFILVFRDRSFPPHGLMLVLHPIAIAAMLGLLRTDWDNRLLYGALASLVGFFITTLVCHRELYLARPSANRLTEFYLWMSFGGVLGGIFSALIAPQIFSTVAEFPILLLLSLACRPGLVERLRTDPSWMEPGIAIIAGCGLIALTSWLLGRYTWPWPVTAGSIALGIVAGAIVLSRWRPRAEVALLALMPLSYYVLPPIVLEGTHERSFFGVYRTTETSDGHFRLLQHGTTVHGAERITEADGTPAEPGHAASYYHTLSPMARGVGVAREIKGGENASVRAGVIGLGTGSMACHAEQGDSWRFFEIDPLIVKIAKDTNRFHMLEACQPDADIVLGDARLTMTREQSGSFDYLVVDAFSSDAIPIHLLTLEAVQLYLSKLTDKGVLALHVSNRHLDLVSVASDLLKRLPGVSAVYVDDQDSDGTYDSMKSDVVFLAKEPALLEPMLAWNKSSRLEATQGRPWTDDYSGIFEAFVRRYRK
jgi:hypothetical protein